MSGYVDEYDFAIGSNGKRLEPSMTTLLDLELTIERRGSMQIQEKATGEFPAAQSCVEPLQINILKNKVL